MEPFGAGSGLLDVWSACDLEAGTAASLSSRSRRYRSVVLTCLAVAILGSSVMGCARRHIEAADDENCIVDPSSIEPRPDPISTPQAIDISAPQNIVDVVRQMLGESGDLPPTSPLKIEANGVTLTVPPGANVGYEADGDDYLFTFRDPKPIVSARVWGFKVNPPLMLLRLKPNNTGEATVNGPFGATTKRFAINWDAGGNTGAATESLPEVWAYSQSSCSPCVAAKKALEAEVDKLPFRVVWKADRPECVTGSYPAFWWHVKDAQPRCDDSANTRVKNGWAGLKPLLDSWKANRIRDGSVNRAATTPRTLPFVRRDPGNLGSRSVAKWSINGDFTPSRGVLLSHLSWDGIHRGKHDPIWLDTLTTEQLRWLHDSDHQGDH